MKTKKKHVAEQLVSPVIDPPLRLSLTVALKGDVGRRYRVYQAAHQALNPSNSQLVESLIRLGLERWEEQR